MPAVLTTRNGIGKPLFAGLSGFLLCISQSLSAQVFTASTSAWPAFPDPPRSKVAWVSNDMRVNGIPMKVLTFESAASVEEVVAYYEAHWDKLDSETLVEHKGKKKGTMVSRPTPNEAVIGKFHGPFYLSVKVKRASLGSSTGTLTTSLLGGNQAGLDVSGLPVPGRSKPLSIVESADPGVISKQGMFAVPDTTESALHYYMHRLPSQGWSLLDKHSKESSRDETGGHILVFARGSEQLDVTLTEAPGNPKATALRVNHIQKTGGNR